MARLKKLKEKQDNGMKYVVAGAVLVEARREPKIAKWLADTLEKNATREADKKRVIGLIDELGVSTEFGPYRAVSTFV